MLTTTLAVLAVLVVATMGVVRLVEPEHLVRVMLVALDQMRLLSTPVVAVVEQEPLAVTQPTHPQVVTVAQD